MFEITCHKSYIQYSQVLGGLLYILNYLYSVLSLRLQSKCPADIFRHMLLTRFNVHIKCARSQSQVPYVSLIILNHNLL